LRKKGKKENEWRKGIILEGNKNEEGKGESSDDL
jgi:hypothetical protein